MGLLDSFTGGKSGSASDAMRRAEEYFAALKTPTADELTLPELKKYVEAGVVTPAEAIAYLQRRNAYEDMTVDQTGTQAQIDALNRLSQIASAGPEGTPMQQAQMANTLSQLNAAVGGQRGAIEQAMAARGVPAALIQAALSSQNAGQDAQQAYLNAINSQGETYRNALNALAQQGSLGNALQGQQNTQANQIAAAANAMQQFNAANQQNVSQFNAANRQDAEAMNAANRQQISNNNVGLSNARTEYNAKVPQMVFDNQYRRAAGAAGVAQSAADLANRQGGQNAGIWSGLINTATSFIPKPSGSSGGGFMPTNPTEAQFNQAYQRGYAHGGIVEDKDPMYCNEGMLIPGDPSVPGDSMMNDTVPIMASPGEAVIPRSVVAENPEVVGNLLSGDAGVDFQDVATLLKAMKAIRLGAV